MPYQYNPVVIKICIGCDKSFETAKTAQKYCTQKCRTFHKQIERNSLNKSIGLSTGTVGAIAELMACVDLMKNGYDVFRAMSPASNCDILAMKGDEIRFYEIRTGHYYISGDKKKLNWPNRNTNGKEIIVITHSDNKVHYVSNNPNVTPDMQSVLIN